MPPSRPRGDMGVSGDMSGAKVGGAGPSLDPPSPGGACGRGLMVGIVAEELCPHPRGVGSTVACESALRSAGTLLSRVRAPLPAPWPDGGPESLRSPCCGLAIYKNSTCPHPQQLNDIIRSRPREGLWLMALVLVSKTRNPIHYNMYSDCDHSQVLSNTASVEEVPSSDSSLPRSTKNSVILSSRGTTCWRKKRCYEKTRLAQRRAVETNNSSNTERSNSSSNSSNTERSNSSSNTKSSNSSSNTERSNSSSTERSNSSSNTKSSNSSSTERSNSSSNSSSTERSNSSSNTESSNSSSTEHHRRHRYSMRNDNYELQLLES
ncbi:hypothetical protein PoB_006629800 [Plakobranchus ocellatus]|uniref:Uncharacterized protein n=1 Tax=Plakobranchus ocellatus TaxID=259542 RepID=A0AAV4D6E4_9GAST|nr:hypothetical protein PoB_006629800 [Plakobranchus ocellatus]